MTLAQPAPKGIAEAAEIRCQIYAHFASVLGHPSSDIQNVLASGHWSSQLDTLGAGLPFPLEPIAPQDAPAAPQHDQLATLYTSHFEVGQGSVSLFGRTYVRRDEKSVFEELFRVYEHFGLSFKDGLMEWPDWIVVELEFMHYLTFLEAGNPGDITPILRGERDFLDKHLVPFTRGLAQALDEKSVPVYSEIAHVLAAFIAADATYLLSTVGQP